MPPAAHEGAGKPIVTSRYEVMRGRQEMRMRVCACVVHMSVSTRGKGVGGGELLKAEPDEGRMSEEVRSCWKGPSALIHGKEKTEGKGYCRQPR